MRLTPSPIGLEFWVGLVCGVPLGIALLGLTILAIAGRRRCL